MTVRVDPSTLDTTGLRPLPVEDGATGRAGSGDVQVAPRRPDRRRATHAAEPPDPLVSFEQKVRWDTDGEMEEASSPISDAASRAESRAPSAVSRHSRVLASSAGVSLDESTIDTSSQPLAW